MTVHPDLEDVDANDHRARCHIDARQRSQIFSTEIAPTL
jgi:hypothetical protein